VRFVVHACGSLHVRMHLRRGGDKCTVCPSSRLPRCWRMGYTSAAFLFSARSGHLRQLPLADRLGRAIGRLAWRSCDSGPTSRSGLVFMHELPSPVNVGAAFPCNRMRMRVPPDSICVRANGGAARGTQTRELLCASVTVNNARWCTHQRHGRRRGWCPAGSVFRTFVA
jgi:hypothetical protein